MTIHIDELVVRTILDEGSSGKANAPGGAGGNINREEVIEECIERILEILREREEP